MKPTFSVVVPTYNRPLALTRCLDSLARLDYDTTRYEVIVVNDGGCILATELLNPLNRPVNITLLRQSHAGSGSARNLGAAHASGEVIAFIDDDCTAAPNWLDALAMAWRKHGEAIIGGRTLNALSDNVYATASQMLISFLYEYYHAENGEARQPAFFTSNNLAVSRALFNQLGGFAIRLRLGEDREFCVRGRDAGYCLHYAEQACVYHWNALGLGSFWGQHVAYGRGNRAYHRARAARGKRNYRVESVEFYRSMLGYPFQFESGGRAAQLSALMVLAQIGNVSGFVAESVMPKAWV
ncbi:MAG TPA: glycosyltransferase [Anaerolineae bacterium]|nr:glycosyltransferase [Anaerolineae bacterium]